MSTPALLIVSAEVRYWEDAEVNGVEDTDGMLIPHRVGELWKPVIDLETGKVIDWPADTVARIHYKVCDAGEYWLADSSANLLRKYGGNYVPDRLLCVGDRGYGDYIILNIGADGLIIGWRKPEIDLNDWPELTEASERAEGGGHV
jgi:hypothetical protein